jgi:hypothetical protein
VALGLGDVIALRDQEGVFGALVAVAGLQPARRAADHPDPLIVNLAWDGVGRVQDLDVPALEVVWAGRNGHGERLARCTHVAATTRADMLTDEIGVVIGRAAHPYRLPTDSPRVAGRPLVQLGDWWPYLYADARRAGIQGNQPFDINEELAAICERAGQVIRAHGVDALLPDPAPDVFAGSGEEYPTLQAMLSRHARAGGGCLLDLTEPKWRWILDRLPAPDAQELVVLRERVSTLSERLQNTPLA